MTRCRCGEDKPRRYLCCRKCFDKMSDTEKRTYESMSRQQNKGTLRRWVR